MTNEQYKQVELAWQKVLEGAKNHYNNVLTTNDLLNMSVKDLQELISFSREFIAQMEMLFCDFRHLIGMGNLKVTERSKLTSLFKDISAFRSDAKRIAQITELTNIAYIPAQSKYKLKLTPGITLTSTLRPGQKNGVVVDEETIDENSKSLINVHSINNKVIVEFNDDNDSIIAVRRLFNEAAGQNQDPKINLDAFKLKLDEKKAWYGVVPSKVDNTYSISLGANHQLYNYIKQHCK